MKPTGDYSLHYQHVWVNRAADRRYPLWLRIGFLALGEHRANGHANFKAGRLAEIFTHLDEETGEIHKPDKYAIRNSIKAAILAGWLAEGSSSLCLVVPAHAIKAGPGVPSERCPIHERKRQRARRKEATLRVVS